ncbi:WD domain-containing protein [Phlyctema vagabunda]|uniref:WD domain-containing protein n=1 Tax=Phlyctema vagabunda TaxID=108571 RepID=A0ABR4PNH2_9HELO
MSSLPTPPGELSAVEPDHAFHLPSETNLASSSQGPSIMTPTSNADMELGSSNEYAGSVEDRLAHDAVEEDQDMSDGGAPLTSPSLVESINMATNIFNPGPSNYHYPPGAYSETGYMSTMDNHDTPLPYPSSQTPYFQSQTPGYTADGGPGYAGFTSGAMDVASLPAALEISQQLQHLQDGQAAHGGPSTGPDEQQQGHDNIQNSTSLPSLHHYPQSADVSGEPAIVSLAQSFAFTSTSLSLVGSANAPHLWGNEGTAPSPVMDGLFSGHDLEGIFPSSSSQDAGDDDDEHDESQADQNEVDEQFNLSLGDFLDRWGMSVMRDVHSKKRSRGPDLASVHEQSMQRMVSVERGDLNGDRLDIQGINWKDLGVSRLEAKAMRRQTYRNYANMRVGLPTDHGARLSDHENYFKFRRMDFEHNIHLSHFQLRNLLTGTSRDNVFYAGRSQVLRIDSSTPNRKSVILDLTEPVVQPVHSFSGAIQISTITSAHDILVAGGFSGEYGLTNLRSHESTRHAEGIITDHHNSITNHVQVHLPRASSSPVAAFASNDNCLRLLDVTTNKFIAEQKFDYAINCSVVSPDQRLRVLVGDTQDVIICNSETGEVLQALGGHHDFGFACDWADDGWTVATGNQDMQVKIWDARKWTDSYGVATPVTTVAAEMAGVRKLKFSPVGSGKRVLVAAEPADFINIIDAETFDSKQLLTFFGEIGGVDFTNNGQDLIVANCDGMRGGIMEFERCNLAGEGLYEHRHYKYLDDGFGRERQHERDPGLDWRPTIEQVMTHPKSQRTATHRRRKVVNLASMAAY